MLKFVKFHQKLLCGELKRNHLRRSHDMFAVNGMKNIAGQSMIINHYSSC